MNSRTAIYVLKRNDKVVYLGKSTNPYERWKYHRKHRDFGEELVMEIIDEFNDPELEWISRFKKEGVLLENKSMNVNYNDDWKIGDEFSKIKPGRKNGLC